MQSPQCNDDGFIADARLLPLRISNELQHLKSVRRNDGGRSVRLAFSIPF